MDGSVCLDTALLLDGIYTESMAFTAKFEHDNSTTVCQHGKRNGLALEKDITTIGVNTIFISYSPQ